MVKNLHPIDAMAWDGMASCVTQDVFANVLLKICTLMYNLFK
jgi:hypothetical protein